MSTAGVFGGETPLPQEETREEAEACLRPGFATRLQLAAVIVYLLSHVFSIPVVAIGRAWQLWPKLDDFATVLLIAVYISSRDHVYPLTKVERNILMLILIGMTYTIPSMVLGSLMFPWLGKTGFIGIIQTFRVLEYTAVWYCVRGMYLSPRQFDLVSYTVFFVTVVTVAICIGNITGIIPAASLVAHLPDAGPWARLQHVTGVSKPYGAFGANPGALADRLIVLTAILLGSRRPAVPIRAALICVVTGVVLLSGARAAAVAFCAMFVFWAGKHLGRAILIAACAALLISYAPQLSAPLDSRLRTYASGRLSSIVHREEDPTFSGRTEIWGAFGNFVLSRPRVLLFGAGWGVAGFIVPGHVGNAHNMYLHTLAELGVLGLIGFLFLLWNVGRLLRGSDSLRTAMRAGFYALLVAGLSGEVLIPTDSGGSFLGIVFVSLAICSAASRGNPQMDTYSEG